MNIKELFYKPIKVKHEASDILVWGCTHFNHACESWKKKGKPTLYEMRGFETLEDHNRALVENWNAKATNSTVGFLLGDVMFGVGGKEKFEDFIDQLNFKTLYTMSGNHYAGWKQSFESVDENVLQFGDKAVIFVPNYLEAFVNGQSVVFSHYPILSWNGQGKGSWMLFSHVHGTLVKSEIGRLYTNGDFKCHETSVELNEFPLDFASLRDIMSEKGGKQVDHHGKETQNAF